MRAGDWILDRSKSTRVLALCLFVLTTCITPFDPELTDETPKLTVEGLITDQPGPYRVKLSYSTTYTSGNAKSDFTIYDAKVYIKDDLGSEEQLSYTKGGTYETKADGIRGEVGRSYSVRIELSDGKVYESVPELLPAVPPIDTIYAEYRDISGEFLQGEFDVFVETKDPKDEENYYLWRWNNYERLDFCRIYTVGKPDAGYITYGTYCCQKCFDIHNCPGRINIRSDKLFDGNTIARVPLLTFPYDNRLPYFVEAEQYSLSKAAHEYWQKVKQLTTNSGGVFDKPPITIRGNLHNVSDPDERVLGFFGASGLKTKSAYFSRSGISDHPYRKLVPDIVLDMRFGCLECEEVTGVRTGVTPAHWDDAPTYYPVILSNN
ncbi:MULTISPECIES: DUF4249 domain-containing protein [unclassified Imperialibacter]|uniref:DUF4249 domain-containing protein n=1 Tax=unclassified Imperialibacter TaxID=2629706 RepID=UPI0012539DDB|nr:MULTISPECIES: DUF4249 domain-containing protein [unclassified Imperialibacter]CAD5250896.1 conserved hypothetical protein [Imperialibacter sp. 89]CAD5283552.1 conserved hypothetical protein [Imperialibacter sp. 75]VVT10433.1 conserved hypothetical protein [Imperialibacter sp. EC-SDR9]